MDLLPFLAPTSSLSIVFTRLCTHGDSSWKTVAQLVSHALDRGGGGKKYVLLN